MRYEDDFFPGQYDSGARNGPFRWIDDSDGGDHRLVYVGPGGTPIPAWHDDDCNIVWAGAGDLSAIEREHEVTASEGGSFEVAMCVWCAGWTVLVPLDASMGSSHTCTYDKSIQFLRGYCVVCGVPTLTDRRSDCDGEPVACYYHRP